MKPNTNITKPDIDAVLSAGIVGDGMCKAFAVLTASLATRCDIVEHVEHDLQRALKTLFATSDGDPSSAVAQKALQDALELLADFRPGRDRTATQR